MTYIVAEVGQNHNGSIDIARALIRIAAHPSPADEPERTIPGVNAVKFTKRDLEFELSPEIMDRPYDSPHSFGRTYREHREYLELSEDEHLELYCMAKAYDLDFIETICHPPCLSMLDLFTPDALKVASRDLTNLPLIDAMAETGIPIILSTGMDGVAELDDALATVTRHHAEITILHCLSQYPAEYGNLNLLSIQYLRDQYPEFIIGYSDHSMGVMAPVAAVAAGASVIEKHVTLDRAMKGSDHMGSLERDGLYRLVRDIRNIDVALGEPVVYRHPAAEPAMRKLRVASST